MEINKLPRVKVSAFILTKGSKWIHRKSGVEYKIILVANEDAEDNDKWPVTVIYQNPFGNIWARPLFAWDKSFKGYE